MELKYVVKYEDILPRCKALAYQSPTNNHYAKDWNAIEDLLKNAENSDEIFNLAMNETLASNQEAACVIISMLDSQDEKK